MVVPFDFDPSGRTKYPVLMHVYGGPDSQLASQQYQIDFMYRIAARKMISVIVDGRGTGFKGRKFRASVTKNLGKYEVQDQVTAAKYFYLNMSIVTIMIDILQHSHLSIQRELEFGDGHMVDTWPVNVSKQMQGCLH